MTRAFLPVALLAAVLFASCSAPATRKPGNPPPASETPRYQSKATRTSPASTFNGKVTSVIDGDSIVVFDSASRSYEVRLSGIDAPEGGQEFGERSRQNLSDLIAEKEVTVTWNKRDRYGRIVGEVSMDDLDVCLEQIKAGMAWHYKYYQSEQTPEDRAFYADAEIQARASRRGLWTEASPIPPWDFRNRR